MATAHKKAARKSPPMQKGTLVMWNDPKGFGFIRPESGEEDYFVHISVFKRGMERRPETGDIVHFRPAELPGKRRASFALVENLQASPPERKPFVLQPRPQSWMATLLIITPLVLSGYLLLARNPLPFFSYVFFSILTMMLYGADKAHAAIKSWRVPEIYLHILELLGGWPGALMAQNAFRHKTRKSLYLYIFWGIIALHLLAWAAYFFWVFRQEAF
jgi:uncharacterized membrane protein YsdA (DUF1294 family)/cold shock CspA family protein